MCGVYELLIVSRVESRGRGRCEVPLNISSACGVTKEGSINEIKQILQYNHNKHAIIKKVAELLNSRILLTVIVLFHVFVVESRQRQVLMRGSFSLISNNRGDTLKL